METIVKETEIKRAMALLINTQKKKIMKVVSTEPVRMLRTDSSLYI